MKRFVRCVALVLALVSLLVPSVSADGFDNLSGVYNGLDFIDETTYLVEPNGSIHLYWSDRFVFYSVDFVFTFLSGPAPTTASLSFNGSSSRTPLTVLRLSENMIRVYGDIPGGTAFSGFNIHFNNSNYDGVSIEKLDFYTLENSHFIEEGTMKVSGGGLSSESQLIMSSSHNAITCWFPDNLSQVNSFYASFQVDDWRLYDYIDFCILARLFDISSIHAFHDSTILPIEVSYLNPGESTYDEVYCIMVRVDLRGIDRTTNYVPYLAIRGNANNWDTEYSANYITLSSVFGYVVDDSQNELKYWMNYVVDSLGSTLSFIKSDLFDYFTELTDILYSNHIVYEEWNSVYVDYWDDLFVSLTDFRRSMNTRFDTLTSAVQDFQLSMEGWFDTLNSTVVTFRSQVVAYLDQIVHQDQSHSQDFEDDVASQATEFEEITETLDAVTKPPVDDLDPSVDDVVSADDVQNYTSFLSVLLGNNIFLSVCLMSLTFALVSYTVYGKR